MFYKHKHHTVIENEDVNKNVFQMNNFSKIGYHFPTKWLHRVLFKSFKFIFYILQLSQSFLRFLLELLKYWIVLLIPIYKLKLCHLTELSSRQHEALSNDMFSCLFWKTRNVFFIHSRKHISLCAIGQHNIKFVHSQRISDRKSESFRSVTMWHAL